jgi:hypothetical protein
LISSSSRSQLQRHGARHPSGDDGDKYEGALNKIIEVQDDIPDDSPLAFVKDYEYVLKHDDLVPVGAHQCVPCVHTMRPSHELGVADRPCTESTTLRGTRRCSRCTHRS